MVLASVIRMRTVFVVPLLAIALVARASAQEPQSAVALIGGRIAYEVRTGDTLSSIGARFGVTVAALTEMNRLAPPGRLAAGDSLLIDNTHIAAFDPQATITINIAQRLLLLADAGRVVAYPVTVGRRTWPTPVGAFTVIGKETNPIWDVPVSIQREMAENGVPVITRMESSPQNPLGSHWLGLSLPGLGIHGTNAPSSIYRFASHGCVRMHPDDVADLYARVRVGDTGVLTYQPVILAAIDGRIWLEANPDEYRRAPAPARYIREALERSGLHTNAVDWTAVERVLSLRHGRAVDVTRLE
jgi:L,D-transpeptidase ErfK/SrfK